MTVINSNDGSSRYSKRLRGVAYVGFIIVALATPYISASSVARLLDRECCLTPYKTQPYNMSCNPSNRPSYTDEQLTCYLQLIGAGDLGDVRAAITKDPLKALTRLQKRSLCKIPFGNVALHYSPHKTLSLDSAALYHKLVERRLGGYCMENSAFFEIVCSAPSVL